MFTKTRNEHIKDVILLLFFPTEKLENFEVLKMLKSFYYCMLSE